MANTALRAENSNSRTITFKMCKNGMPAGRVADQWKFTDRPHGI